MPDRHPLLCDWCDRAGNLGRAVAALGEDPREQTMGPDARPHDFAHLWSQDRDIQNAAYSLMVKATSEGVPWAYEVWDEVVANLTHPDNHNRAIAAQVLCNLAQSDPERRIHQDFDRLLEVSRDARFVTARHCLTSLWKVGLAGLSQRQLVVDGLEKRFRESSKEKNSTLIRFDISQSLRQLYDATNDEAIRSKALELIGIEDDLKYRSKYSSVWTKAS